MLDNIPEELRALPQWVVTLGEGDKRPINPRTGRMASVVDPTTWGTFAEAVQAGYPHIGFVLASTDPYCIIDLDNKPSKPATPEQLQRHSKILRAFDSYTEKSSGGMGYHIIVKGSIPMGVNRDNVEVYSSGRYMICTGDVVSDVPINDSYQPLLTVLYQEMESQAKRGELVEGESHLSDEELLSMAMNADNSEKFNSLCSGVMDGYNSQSEADLALLSIIAFYTQDNEQVRRLFRASALGKRDKATRNDVYLNTTLSKIRAKQPAPVDITQLMANAAALMDPDPEEVAGEEEEDEPYAYTTSEAEEHEVSSLPGIAVPDGLIKELADYFYSTAIRPVPEIALAAAIALVAGVCGRSYNISGSGLNHYIILLAKTGSGKEGALSGMDSLLSAVRPQLSMVDNIMGPAAFASGQALVKILNDKPCFVSVLGEFGLTLQQISDNRANPAQLLLRKVLLDLYTKSGWDRSLRASVYADTEKNTKVIRAPCVTILGESTPETFFDGLDSSHIAEGLIPRFSIIEYVGDRPARNRNANIPPSKELVQKFVDLVMISQTTANNNTCCNVTMDPESLEMMDSFDAKVDGIINGTKIDVELQLWNRAHLKALKLAALFAVGRSPHEANIDTAIARWAIAFVESEVRRVATRFREGDVGKGDHKQFLDLRDTVADYFNLKLEQRVGYRINERLFEEKLVPYNFLIKRTASLSSFRNDRSGATNALKKTLTAFLDSGMLVEIPRATLQSKLKYSGAAYGVGEEFKKKR